MRSAAPGWLTAGPAKKKKKLKPREPPFIIPKSDALTHADKCRHLRDVLRTSGISQAQANVLDTCLKSTRDIESRLSQIIPDYIWMTIVQLCHPTWAWDPSVEGRWTKS